jgi:uncharacterized DUF497 family protein
MRDARIVYRMHEPAAFEWDDGKAASNVLKHGVSFDVAAGVFLDGKRIEAVDTRHEYGEERVNTIGSVDGICLTVTYTMRGDAARLISARTSTRKERARYDNP